MRKTSIYSAIAMIAIAMTIAFGISLFHSGTVNAFEAIEINETNFPDENFREYLERHFRSEYLTEADIKNTYTMTIYGENISDLKGIEFFTGLTDLNCNRNNLTRLDLSKNTLLKELRCDSNKLTSLNLSGNAALNFLDCSYNKLTNLDLRNCPLLENLFCSNNKLESIDISKCIYLYDLDIRENNLTSINVTKNTLLDFFDCSYNELTSIDVSKNKKLWLFYCYDNQLSTLDVSMNTNMEFFNCEDNFLDKVFFPDVPDGKYGTDSGVKWVVLKPSDWKYAGTEWRINEFRLDQTIAYARFKCIKAGEEDYKVTEKMTVTSKTTDNIGEIEFTAKLSADISRTGKAIKEKAYFPERQPTATPTPAVKISLKRTANVVCGDSLTLKASVSGTKKSVVWKSSNSNIATVNSNGKVTAKQAGSVTITASVDGKKAECKVQILYKDVTKSSDFWYEPTYYLTDKNVAKGYANQTEFRPANPCTRAQMVTFLYRLQGEPKIKSDKCQFDDVKSTDYFYKPVMWAVEKGITTGVSGKKFDPDGVCTRAQTVTFLWRMANKPSPKSNTCKFSDVKNTDYFYKPVIWATEKNIVAANSEGLFKPQDKCLRRQMVTFLYKYDKYINGK